uniref:F-box/LRR-repeat protein 3 n=1 Tax=Anthurium amnicola TaxID=1678845 RepID=A0A1D1XKH7_9ARAE
MRSSPPGRSILAVLSADLLVQILDRLPDPSHRKAWRLVCRDFLRAEALQRRSLRLLRREPLPGVLRRYASLERLDLSACPRIDDRAARAAFGGVRLRALRSVNLSRASALRWGGLALMVAACPALEAVDLSYCAGVGDREVAALAMARGLRELTVTKCLGVTDVGLARVAVGCPGLQRLGLKWCLEISDIGVDLLVKKCRLLQDLDLSYLKVTNASLLSISTLERLEVLSMVGCSFIDDDGLAYLNNGSYSLKSVDVSRCDNVSSSGLSSVIKGNNHLQTINAGHCFPCLQEHTPPFLVKLKHLGKSLNTIKLDGFHVSSLVLGTIGLHCKNLVEIGLGKCDGVADEGVSELVSGCANLRIIDLTCCHLITDSALSAIARSCNMLAHLRLESCTSITEKGLDHVAALCSHLAEIDLTDCGINDEALRSLSKCSNLVEMKLGLCSSITDKGLAHIGSNCKKLQAIDLYQCTEISDDGLAAIASGCKSLKKINLCYCSRITDLGMKHLSALELLSDLEMRKLVNVTSAGVTAIAIGCKSLTELDLKKCCRVDDEGFRALTQHSENLRQINVSYCPISDVGICVLLGSLRCLQDAKLVHLSRVSLVGFELALRAACERMKKLKLLTGLRYLLSQELLQGLQARGCRIRWVDKSPVVG